MRKKVVAGNWKMNTIPADGKTLAAKINEFATANPSDNVQIILAPPFTHLASLCDTVDFKRISVAAQDCSQYKKGAYTGEVSAEMIASTGCHYVIIGHSERRAYHKEDNALLAAKVNEALNNALRPIYCCGETLEERESGKLYDVVKDQVENGLFHLENDLFKKIIIAYEPVWAIGTGKTASPQQASEMHAFIRKLVSDKYGLAIADDLVILYGGSVNAANARELFSMPHVDGGLVGGASLKADDFIEIIKAGM